MNKRQQNNKSNPVGQFWGRLLTLRTSDAELQRIGRMFISMMVLGAAGSLFLFGVYIAAGFLGYIPMWRDVWAQAIFPLLLLLAAIICIAFTRRGQVRAMIQLYIWSSYLGISLAIFLFGGSHSSGWLLYFWPVMLGGMLIHPLVALLLSGGVLVYYFGLWGLETLELYMPVIPTSMELFRFTAIIFGLSMLAMTGGILNYVVMNDLRVTLRNLLRLKENLEKNQASLEERVTDRTTELQYRADQLQAIAEVNRATSSILQLDELLKSATSLIANRFAFDHAGIFLIDPGNRWAVLRAASSEGGRTMLRRGHRLQVGEQGIVGYVAQTGTARISLDVGEDAVWFNNPDLPDTRSELALPLIARGHTIGVLDIQTNKPRAFSDQDMMTLRILADGLAVAIDNARLLDASSKSVARLDRLQEQEAVDAWRQALTRRNMHLDRMYSTGNIIPVSIEEIGDIADVHTTNLFTRLNDQGMHQLITPIKVRDRNVGIFAFEKSAPWHDEEIKLVTFVMGQLGLALENARLLEETRLRAHQERARSDIVSRLRGLGTTDAILRSAARELGQALQVERSRIQLLPPGEEGMQE